MQKKYYKAVLTKNLAALGADNARGLVLHLHGFFRHECRAECKVCHLSAGEHHRQPQEGMQSPLPICRRRARAFRGRYDIPLERAVTTWQLRLPLVTGDHIWQNSGKFLLLDKLLPILHRDGSVLAQLRGKACSCYLHARFCPF